MDPERCDECGFDGSRFDGPALVVELRGLGDQWNLLLDEAGANLRVRPASEVWSAIEYAAHSRDVTALHAWGVEQILTQDYPVFPEVGDDVVNAASATYAGEDPAEVASALGEHASRLAALASDAGESAWTRAATIGNHDVDVRRLLEHAIHDSTHHLRDVERGLIQLRAATH